MQISHIGKDVWVISQLPWGNCGNIYYSADSLIDFIKANNKRYLIAFTANQGQQGARQILHKQKFQKAVTFKSQHGGRETLTLWLKISETAKDNSDAAAITTALGSNCSISANPSYKKNCTITTKKIIGFKKLAKTPLYVRIVNRNLVKGTKLFPQRKKILGIF